jgi:hypothetical protein
MAELEHQQARRFSADNQIISKAEIPLKERFFRYFQHEITGKAISMLGKPVDYLGQKEISLANCQCSSSAAADGSACRYIARGW